MILPKAIQIKIVSLINLVRLRTDSTTQAANLWFSRLSIVFTLVDCNEYHIGLNKQLSYLSFDISFDRVHEVITI